VVSTGAGAVTPAAVRIADEIAAVGLTATRSWDGAADPDLRARTNVQGVAADANGWVWVHVEHNRTIRDTPTLWEPAMDAVAGSDPQRAFGSAPSSSRTHSRHPRTGWGLSGPGHGCGDEHGGHLAGP
jgi:hypothetical protein